MIRKELGSTALSLPEVGLGTWRPQAGPEPARRGLGAGARFIDTAESCGPEEMVGRAVRGLRKPVCLATKGAPRHFRRADVLRAADQSMRRLDIDCIGLYRLHEPSSAIPIEETMDAMEELGEAGKARFIGVSNLSVVQMRSAPAGLRKQRLVTRQVRYNLVDCTILATLAFSSPDLELRKMPDRPWFRRSGMFQRAAFLPAWPVLRAHLTVSPGRGSNAAVVGRLADR